MRASLLSAALAVLLSTGCGRDLQRLKVLIAGPDGPAPGAMASGGREYRSLTQVYADLDRVQAEASVALYPSFADGLHPGAFARIAHVTDVQVREERAVLLGGTETDLLESASQAYTPIEGTRRDALMQLESAYVWLATAITLNALHQQYPFDLAVHTGDATDIGLKSELQQFLHVAHKLEMPFLNVVGNHDVLAFGLWNGSKPFAGVYLNSVDMTPEIATVFAENGDGLMQDRATHLGLAGEATARLGAHEPTRALGSERLGYDLSPDSGDAYYTTLLRAPADGLPGLQLVVLRTSADLGGADAEMTDAQLAWLNDTLDAASTRGNLVVVAAHHPLMDVRRTASGLGAVGEVVVVPTLERLRNLLVHYPNVVAYLCGHTHLPEVVELKDGAGTLQLVQIDSGGLLTYPQEGAVVELLLDPASGQVTVAAQKVGAMLAGGSELAKRVVEAVAAAARDDRSRPAYPDWRAYSGGRPLPAFPVAVPKFEL